MNYYRAQIQYAGTEYAGFQWQSGLKTVQSELNEALLKLIEGKITTKGASRTDTGVHALDQIVKITSENPINCLSTLPLLNATLPHSIRCLGLNECAGSFQPGTLAVSKEYRYFFTNKKQVSTGESQFIANIANQLDEQSMQNCIEMLKGVHDFVNFCSAGSNVKSTVRTIHSCELKKSNPHDLFSKHEIFKIPVSLTECYEFRIEANGFIKQMIRHLISSLWMVGSGKLSVEDFRNLLNGPKHEKQLWKVAPANGLYLFKINY